MAWCNAKADAWKDLSVPANARDAVGELLTDLYYPPKPGAQNSIRGVPADARLSVNPERSGCP
jgi:hypothetical protein